MLPPAIASPAAPGRNFDTGARSSLVASRVRKIGSTNWVNPNTTTMETTWLVRAIPNPTPTMAQIVRATTDRASNSSVSVLNANVDRKSVVEGTGVAQRGRGRASTG